MRVQRRDCPFFSSHTFVFILRLYRRRTVNLLFRLILFGDHAAERDLYTCSSLSPTRERRHLFIRIFCWLVARERVNDTDSLPIDRHNVCHWFNLIRQDSRRLCVCLFCTSLFLVRIFSCRVLVYCLSICCSWLRFVSLILLLLLVTCLPSTVAFLCTDEGHPLANNNIQEEYRHLSE